MWWMVNDTPRPLYSWERPGTHCIGGWVGPTAFWTGAENLAPSRIRSPDRPARSQSLYRLSYPGPILKLWYCNLMGPPSYMLSVVDRKVVMRRMNRPCTWTLLHVSAINRHPQRDIMQRHIACVGFTLLLFENDNLSPKHVAVFMCVCEWIMIYLLYIVWICWCVWIITDTMHGTNCIKFVSFVVVREGHGT